MEQSLSDKVLETAKVAERTLFDAYLERGCMQVTCNCPAKLGMRYQNVVIATLRSLGYVANVNEDTLYLSFNTAMPGVIECQITKRLLQ